MIFELNEHKIRIDSCASFLLFTFLELEMILLCKFNEPSFKF